LQNFFQLDFVSEIVNLDGMWLKLYKRSQLVCKGRR